MNKRISEGVGRDKESKLDDSTIELFRLYLHEVMLKTKGFSPVLQLSWSDN